MQSVLAMFPGQGSQYVGMGLKLAEEFSYVHSVFEEAEDGSGLPLRKFCFEGSEAELKKTAIQQPAILAVSLAIYTVLKKEVGFIPTHAAGHSLGEYSALVAAGYFTLLEASKLVRARGEAMQNAVQNTNGDSDSDSDKSGVMAALLGCDEKIAEELCQEASQISGLPFVIANYNANGQLILSGLKKSYNSFLECLAKRGLKCKLIVLPVSAPFHSPHMLPAKETLRPLLKPFGTKKLNFPIFINTTAQLILDYSHQNLIDQVDHPVQWIKTFSQVKEMGIEKCVEIGPSKVLIGLAKKNLESSAQLFSTDDIKAFLSKWVA